MRVVETKRVDSVEGDDRVVFGALGGLRVFRRFGGLGKIEKRGDGRRVEIEASDVDDRVSVVTGAQKFDVFRVRVGERQAFLLRQITRRFPLPGADFERL